MNSDWNDFFRTIYPRRIRIDYTFSGVDDYLPDCEIISSEFPSYISRIENNEALGPDGSPGEYLKALPDEWSLYLLGVSNKMMVDEELPGSWSQVSMKMLHKKGTRTDPYNYRGIALVNTVTKLFTRIIYNGLSAWTANHDILPKEQGGF